MIRAISDKTNLPGIEIDTARMQYDNPPARHHLAAWFRIDHLIRTFGLGSVNLISQGCRMPFNGMADEIVT